MFFPPAQHERSPIIEPTIRKAKFMTTYEPFSNSLHMRSVRPIERHVNIDMRFILMPVRYKRLACPYPSVTQNFNTFFVSALETIISVFSGITDGGLLRICLLPKRRWIYRNP